MTNADEYRSFLRDKRAELVQRIADACSRAGRDASEVTLLAVSKTVGVDEVALAYEAGYRCFGENRPQELKRKVAFVRETPGMDDVSYHMIGNLQKNKINQVLGNADLVHSVSSEHLAKAISQRAVARDMRVRCLLETNVSGESSKSGFSADEVLRVIDEVMAMEGIELEGLMTMAPAYDLDAARSTFCGLRELRDELRTRTGLGLDTLSCGMSDDFEVAIEEGSTLVRLGRIVFDPSYAAWGGQAST